MKTLFTFVVWALFVLINVNMQARPDEPPAHKKITPGIRPIGKKPERRNFNQSKIIIQNAERLFCQLDLDNAQTPLNEEVFVAAYIGFRNLVAEGKVAEGNHLLSICDFSLSANIPRLWVLDLHRKKLLYNTLVAHGQGTGEEFATQFSNTENSHQSSLGFYITEGTYYGSNGYSLRMQGMDQGYNHNAYDRAIVIHGADYVSSEFIRSNKRLGRSWGCPALPQKLAGSIIDRIKEGSVFYIHYPQQQYLASSRWINTPIRDDIQDTYLDDPAKDKKERYAYTPVQPMDTMIKPDKPVPGRLSTTR